MAASALLLRPLPVTPPTYHRIVSPSLRSKIVSDVDPTTPIPVGLLACQRDPLLRELATTVLSCREHQSVAPAANQRKKKGAASSTPSQPLYEVVLHDTVLFPEGGGQPFDIGQLKTENGVVYDVQEVKRVGGHAVHFVQSNDGAVALVPGQKVTTILHEDGFKRRLDHMSMHTSQHLLSALLETRLNLPTLSWALTTYPTPAYVELPRALTPEELIGIQDEANRLAFEGREVYVEVEELVRGNEPGVAKHESGRSVGKALPEDYTGGVKRTIIINGVDRNPCCGTHLPSLHNLQLFLLPQGENLSRPSGSTCRLFFLCGPRLITHLTSSHNLLTSASNVLSCGTQDVPSRIGQVVDERKVAQKRVEDLESEMAAVIAERLVSGLKGDGSFMKHHMHRMDDASNPLGFLQLISSNITSKVTESATTGRYLFVLSSSPSSQSNASTTITLITASDEKDVKAVGDALKAKLGVKGGGKGLKWSGKWTGVWKDTREGAVVQEILYTVV